MASWCGCGAVADHLIIACDIPSYHSTERSADAADHLITADHSDGGALLVQSSSAFCFMHRSHIHINSTIIVEKFNPGEGRLNVGEPFITKRYN